jgi:hypothetical protein
MDPSSARLVDADLVETALAYPVYGNDAVTAGAYARARRSSQAANPPGAAWRAAGSASDGGGVTRRIPARFGHQG